MTGILEASRKALLTPRVSAGRLKQASRDALKQSVVKRSVVAPPSKGAVAKVAKNPSKPFKHLDWV